MSVSLFCGGVVSAFNPYLKSLGWSGSCSSKLIAITVFSFWFFIFYLKKVCFFEIWCNFGRKFFEKKIQFWNFLFCFEKKVFTRSPPIGRAFLPRRSFQRLGEDRVCLFLNRDTPVSRISPSRIVKSGSAASTSFLRGKFHRVFQKNWKSQRKKTKKKNFRTSSFLKKKV